MSFSHFTEIKAWQAARQLVKEIYALTRDSRFDRDRVIADQIRRAALSSMSNIAEGLSRRTNTDFARFPDVARGSVSEVHSTLFACEDVLGFSGSELSRARELADIAISMTAGLQAHLRGPRTGEADVDYVSG